MSQEGEGATRRYVLQTLGALGTGSIAGCSGDSNNNPGGGDTSTDTNGASGDDQDGSGDSSNPGTDGQETDIQNVGPDQWVQQYLLSSGESYEGILFDSWSPHQVKQSTGTIPLEVSYLENPYGELNFGPEEVPETFLQVWNQGNYWTSAKIDQLPGDISGQSVKQSLERNGYWQVKEIGGFSVYSSIGESVHAVSSNRHAIATNIIHAGADEASTEQHRRYLEDVIREKENNDGEEPEGIAELMGALGPKDTFGAVNEAGGQDLLYEGKFIYNSDFGEGYQPTHGATSIDLDEGIKYAAWIFEDEDTARVSTESLQDEQYYNDWESLSRDGRIMQAAGQVDLASEIENSKHIKNRGLLISPQI